VTGGVVWIAIAGVVGAGLVARGEVGTEAGADVDVAAGAVVVVGRRAVAGADVAVWRAIVVGACTRSAPDCWSWRPANTRVAPPIVTTASVAAAATRR